MTGHLQYPFQIELKFAKKIAPGTPTTESVWQLSSRAGFFFISLTGDILTIVLVTFA